MKRVYVILKSLCLLRRRKTWGPFVEAANTTKFDYSFNVSWSQGGEDLALLSLLGTKKHGTYLDIGAHHPTRFSVTRHLYQRGWDGVNVDANSDLIFEFSAARTRDTNLCYAVGLKDTYEFTIFQEPAVSTVNPEWKSKFISQKFEIDRIEKVSGRTLRSIYDEFFSIEPVDLLTIDAEGADLEVLESMDFPSLINDRYPKYLLLETSPPVAASLENPSVTYAIKIGYEPYFVLPMSTVLRRKKV